MAEIPSGITRDVLDNSWCGMSKAGVIWMPEPKEQAIEEIAPRVLPGVCFGGFESNVERQARETREAIREVERMLGLE